MILSQKNKFIFIHVPKTAGSSVNSTLSAIDESSKIISTIQINGESSWITLPGLKQEAIYFDNSQDWAHPPYPLNKILCKKFIEDPEYFSFSFVRNPFDRIVSAFTYAQRRSEFEENDDNVDPHFNFRDFNEFCEKYLTREDLCSPITRKNIHFLPQYRFLYDPKDAIKGGSPIVSFVGRFENLQSDFDLICEKIGAEKVTLPRVRDQKQKKEYWKHYSKESREIVEKIYKKDLEILNYDFQSGNKTHIEIRKSVEDSILEGLNLESPDSKSEAEGPEGDIICNKGKDIALICLSGGKRHSVEVENNLLHYAAKHDHTVIIYRKQISVPRAILNAIDSYDNILLIKDSSIITDFSKKIKDLTFKTKFLTLDEHESIVLVNNHQYTKKLLKRWEEGLGDIFTIMKKSDPSRSNFRYIDKDPTRPKAKLKKFKKLASEPQDLEGESLLTNFKNCSDERKLLLMREFNKKL